MKLSHKTLSLLIITSSTSLSLSTTASALVVSPPKTVTQSLNFQTNNQSMWSSGDGYSFSNTTTLGTSWNNSGGLNGVTLIPSVCFGLGCTPEVKSPSINASTSGNISLTNTFTATSGTVNADLPIDLTFSLPSVVKAGEKFSIFTDYSFKPTGTFQTFSPGISENLDLNFKSAVNLDIAGVANPGFDVDKTFNLLTIDNIAVCA